MEYKNRYGDYGYRRKHTKRTHRARRLTLALTVLLLVALLGAGTTLAFLSTGTQEAENVFTPGKVSCEVKETFDGKVKTDVAVTNTGNTDAYIRAAVVATWVKINEDGSREVSAKAPLAGTDYAIVWNETDWTQGADGYWYCKKPVAAGASTAALIQRCTQTADGPDGYVLSVEIVASAVQASPTTVVAEQWNVTVNDGSEVTPK